MGAHDCNSKNCHFLHPYDIKNSFGSNSPTNGNIEPEDTEYRRKEVPQNVGAANDYGSRYQIRKRPMQSSVVELNAQYDQRRSDSNFFRHQGAVGGPAPGYQADSAAIRISAAGQNGSMQSQNGHGTNKQLPDPLVADEYCGMIMCNIQGMQTYRNKYKVDILREKALEENCAFISVVETHLNQNILDV